MVLRAELAETTPVQDPRSESDLLSSVSSRWRTIHIRTRKGVKLTYRQRTVRRPQSTCHWLVVELVRGRHQAQQVFLSLRPHGLKGIAFPAHLRVVAPMLTGSKMNASTR